MPVAAMNALVVKIPDPKHVMSSRWSLLQGFGNAQYIFSREIPHPQKNHTFATVTGQGGGSNVCITSISS